MSPRRVLVVDDSAVARRVVSGIVTGALEGAEVLTAPNGRRALELLAHTHVDAVILDVEMPELDGIETLRAIIERSPELPVIMFSALTERAGNLTLDALHYGARDYVTKPSASRDSEGSFEAVRQQLGDKLRALLAVGPLGGGAVGAAGTITRTSPIELVVLGASMGGPVALTELLGALPGELAVPIVAVVHMPAMFTRLFAERLDAISPLRVRELDDAHALEPGAVYLAQGGTHAVVRARGARLFAAPDDAEAEQGCRPSVDVLFRSAAAALGARTLAVVLTGMGEDGARGARDIRARGGLVLAQDRASSVSWGMPGAVIQAGVAHEALGLGDIPRRILELVGARGGAS